MGRYDPEQQARLEELSQFRRYIPDELTQVAMQAERIAREQGMEWTYSYVVAAVLQKQGQMRFGE